VKVEEFLFRKLRLPRKVFRKVEPGEMPDAPSPRALNLFGSDDLAIQFSQAGRRDWPTPAVTSGL
jgi:hypothetical protein